MLSAPQKRKIVTSRQTHENIDTFMSIARCPLCNKPLIAIVTKHGPNFQCDCKEKNR